MPKVSIVSCEDYDAKRVRQALIAGLEPLGGTDWVRPGMKIGIKTNLITAKSPSAAATTHPVMLAELSRLLIEKGARVIVGDSPGGPFTVSYLKTVYSRCGLDAVVKAGAELNYNMGGITADFPEGVKLKKVTYTSWLKDCDCVICFAKLKTHGMLGMTGAVKNLFGVVPGLMKPEFHYLYPKTDDFCNMILDLNEFIKPKLCLIDGVMAMEGNGPSAGTPRKLGCVIASDNPYHADLAAADIIGLTADDLPLIDTAARRGLAPRSVDDVDISGDITKYKVGDFKNIPYTRISFGSENSITMNLIRILLARRPKVDGNKCVSCGLCFKNCPADAIKMKKVPVFDTRKCIRCFCCQELCPKEAIKVHIPLAARILR